MSKTPAQDHIDTIGMDEICVRTADCESMRKIAESIGVSWMALNAYINANDDRKEQYARAREAQADKFAEDIIDIADSSGNDITKDKDGNDKVNQEVIARDRLRVDARKWLASKMAPKKYGEKLDLTADITTKSMTDEQIESKIAALMLKGGGAE